MRLITALIACFITGLIMGTGLYQAVTGHPTGWFLLIAGLGLAIGTGVNLMPLPDNDEEQETRWV